MVTSPCKIYPFGNNNYENILKVKRPGIVFDQKNAV